MTIGYKTFIASMSTQLLTLESTQILIKKWLFQPCVKNLHCCLILCRSIYKGIHNFIHLNLAIALFLALAVFVSGIEPASDSRVSVTLFSCLCPAHWFIKMQVGCKVVAALLHYFFTAVFAWMLCEGIMLYFLLVKVFNTGLGQRKLFYLAIGWGRYFKWLYVSRLYKLFPSV